MPEFHRSKVSAHNYQYWVQNGAIYKTPAMKSIRVKFKVKTKAVQFKDLPIDLQKIEPFLQFKPLELWNK